MTQPASSRNHDLASLRNNGPYVLRTLLDDVPLSDDGSNLDVKINCVEYFGANLYGPSRNICILMTMEQTGTYTLAHLPPSFYTL